MGASSKNEARTKRFSLRATARQDRLIRVAAERKGLKVSDFILESAFEKAEQTLQEPSHLVVNSEQWEMFVKALDEPPRVIPQIRRLFSDPSVAESR